MIDEFLKIHFTIISTTYLKFVLYSLETKEICILYSTVFCTVGWAKIFRQSSILYIRCKIFQFEPKPRHSTVFWMGSKCSKSHILGINVGIWFYVSHTLWQKFTFCSKTRNSNSDLKCKQKAEKVNEQLTIESNVNKQLK